MVPTIHLISNAHLDPVWKWDWEEGLTEALSTFETAVELLEENPAFVFNHNESVLYEWTLEYRPDLFRRIQCLVAEGRWHIAGGWYLQPDCNFPDGESFIRQILVGRRFFRQHFNVEPAVAYNFDAFGHHGNLPQILQKAGYRAYIHFRPAPHELELPGSLYRWRGIDGSEVLAYRPPFAWYGTDDEHDVGQRIEASVRQRAQDPAPIGLFWGMGDHGGGATRLDLKEIARRQKSFPAVRQSTTDALLEDFEAIPRGQLPVHSGDLQRSFTGCYTSIASIKQSNRRAEALAQLAERYATLAWWFANVPYPREKMLSIWKDTLFNQFHDILPGSSTRPAMEGAAEIAGRQHKHAREVILKAQLELARTTQRREPLTLLVFNPLPHAARFPVDLEYMVGHRPAFAGPVVTRVSDARGRDLPSQEEMGRSVSDEFDWRKRVVFEADLPAMGCQLFRLHLDARLPGRSDTPPGVTLRKRDGRWNFSNAHASLALDPATGWLASWRLAGSRRNLLKAPGGRLLVLRDEGDAWGSNVHAYDEVAGLFRLATPQEVPSLVGQPQLGEMEPVRIIEQGAVRTIVEVVQVYQRSTAVLRYTIYANRPEVELDVRLIWNEPRHMVKLCWPLRYDRERYRVEVPYGDIEREQNSGEQPNGRWVLFEAPKVPEAVGLVALGPGGHDMVDGEFRLSLLRSAVYCHFHRHALRSDLMHDVMDLGETRFRLALLAAPARSIRSALLGLTERLTLPPGGHVHLPLGPSAVEGVAPGAALISLKGEGVELGAVKPAEEADALLFRLVERRGRAAKAALTIAGRAEAVSVSFRPYEIVTLLMDRNGNVQRCDLLERPAAGPALLSGGNG